MKRIKSLGIISILCALMLCIGLFAACSTETLTYTDQGEAGYTVKAANTDISGDIIIPTKHEGKPVYALDVRAFKNCKKITSITIPEGMTSIAAEAFSGCENCEVIIPTSVTEIGPSAFTDTIIGFSITYKGTKEQWRKIKSNTTYGYSSVVVTCSDGQVKLSNGKDI